MVLYMRAVSEYVVFDKKFSPSKRERMPLANHCSSFCHHALPVTIVLWQAWFHFKQSKGFLEILFKVFFKSSLYTFHVPHPRLTYPNIGFLDTS